ncbi:hypothetical protein QJS10_CPA03g00836 [Acorus calamus]|uniref:RNA-directed DNA polymerase (Reverse transcriptase) n=1 Tax=Acorus calamus TaxID=4465 RepID=A0AAV9F5Z5_ACOCL|nr:hypothetical protein QJS10_CPA03g00836 [Acorus calamus]
MDIRGSAMFQLASKLRRLKVQLKSWSRAEFDPSMNLLSKQRHILERVQSQLQSDPLNHMLINRESQERLAFKSLLATEESMIRQKSRQNWLQLGDSNTAFFYASFAGRKAQNTLRRVTLSDGSISEDPAVVKNEVVSFFSNLLNQTSPPPVADKIDFKATLSAQEAAGLVGEVTEEEILDNLKRMKANGSPEPDGFNVFFFKHCWEIVGRDVVKAVQEFFLSGQLLKQLNHSFICLVPKGTIAD